MRALAIATTVAALATVANVAAMSPRLAASLSVSGGPPAKRSLGPAVLRVCADPNNLPFSNRAERGFENRIVELLARDLGMRVEYTWWAQRRGFVRNTLGAGECDLIPAVPAGYEAVATTRPYYRSTFVFVTRRAAGRPIDSFDDPRLRRLKVGVHLVGDDYANPPPVEALARRGIVRNVVGYTIYGDYRQPDPPARLLEAVARGDVDVAVVWGPLGGWFAREHPSLRASPVRAALDGPGVPFAFSISMATRKADTAFARRVDAALARRRAEIEHVLDRYGVPRLDQRTGRDP
ncbi:MAG TPA: substrate-binding domain-containing protein [Gemmatimonadales bacterium]|nr:substrate-binding domain-containing protein [Gemmatimonadales bacterium]